MSLERVTITHPTGLHARPAIKFTKLAKTFSEAEIKLRGNPEGDWVDAKSIVKVMGLKLACGTVMEIDAEGAQAETALEALRALVEDNFGEAV